MLPAAAFSFASTFATEFASGVDDAWNDHASGSAHLKPRSFVAPSPHGPGDPAAVFSVAASAVEPRSSAGGSSAGGGSIEGSSAGGWVGSAGGVSSTGSPSVPTSSSR